MRFRISHIGLAIVLAPLVSLVAPIFPLIHENMMGVVIGLAVFLALAAAWRKAWFDVGIALAVAAVFAASRSLFADTDTRTLALRTAAILAFVFLNLVLLIGPWSRFSKHVQAIYRHRRHLGVTAFFLAKLHFSLVFSNYFQYSFANTFMTLFTFFGFTAYFIMFFLAITSWDYLQKHVGNRRWKQIHLVVAALYAGVTAYAFWVNLSHGLTIETWQWIAAAVFFIMWYVMAPWGLAPKLIKNLMGWKQLHTLIHIGYLSVVLHAWFGVVFAQPTWVKMTFWGLALFVWGSHAAGWIIKRLADRRLQAQAAQARQITVDGNVFWSADRVETFEEGRGRKFLINKLPVAVFKHREKFFGMFAVCAHQKGPIEDGKIVNGYVECPWHHWQYSCEDGAGPPGFSDRLAFFPCLVQDGMVYVSASPKRLERKVEVS